jgi:hypothetical protein
MINETGNGRRVERTFQRTIFVGPSCANKSCVICDKPFTLGSPADCYTWQSDGMASPAFEYLHPSCSYPSNVPVTGRTVAATVVRREWIGAVYFASPDERSVYAINEESFANSAPNAKRTTREHNDGIRLTIHGDRTDFFAELAEMLNLDDYGDVRTERRVICELAKIGAVWALEARDKVD